MEKMLEISTNAYDWFNDKPPINWSRSHFKVDPKCDILLNNLCESFNAAILEFRDKPVLTMLEKLRTYLMLRMARQRETNWTQPVGPRVFNIIEAKRKDSDRCKAEHSGEWQFEVKHIHGERQFHVDLRAHTCTCRKWDLCGLPCAHAMAAIAKMDRSVYDYIHSCYKRPAYDSAYAKYICPMSSSELWPKTTDKPIKPPPCQKRTGRRKTNRIKEPGELPKNATKLPRYDHAIHCSICGVEGHNQRSCLQVSQGNLLFVYALIKL